MARCHDGRRSEVAVLTVTRVVETGSTNADLLERALRGDAHEGDWLVAERQVAGRGRQGRSWQSPKGNFYGSTVVELRPGDPSAPTLALAAGVAAHESLDIPDLTLKWPNDVLHAGTGAKLAGVLLERQHNAVVIGVGINLAHAPTLPDRQTTSLAALGLASSVATLFESLNSAVACWLGVWRTHGLGPICRAWMARAHPIGTPLSVAMHDSSPLAGRFDGLTDDGALRLRLADGSVRVIHAGDVFLV